MKEKIGFCQQRIAVALRWHGFSEEEKKSGYFDECVAFALENEYRSRSYAEFIRRFTEIR